MVSFRHKFDGGSAEKLLKAVATATNTDIKVQAFRTAAHFADKVAAAEDGNGFDSRPGYASAQMADGMTSVLQSDATGMVNALTISDPDGKALSQYCRVMLDRQRPDELGQVMNKLLHGNKGREDSASYISHEEKSGSSGKPYFKRAEDLGYFAGAIQAGLNRNNADVKAQGDLAAKVLTGALFATSAGSGAITGAGPIVFRTAIPIIHGMSQQALGNIVAGEMRDGRGLADVLEEQALPRDKDGKHIRGPESTPFRAFYDHVVIRNQ